MMELLLNLLWSAIAIGSLLAYFRFGPRDRRQFHLGLGALLCILTLLLPAISATDDLHSQAFAVEDSTPTKRLVKAAALASPVSQIVGFGFALLTLFLAFLRRKTWRVIESTRVFRSEPHFSNSLLGRAPPLVLA